MIEEVRFAETSLLEGEGFEPSAPPGEGIFETAPEPGDEKPARQPEWDFDDRHGQVYRALARLALAMISTPGHRLPEGVNARPSAADRQMEGTTEL